MNLLHFILILYLLLDSCKAGRYIIDYIPNKQNSVPRSLFYFPVKTNKTTKTKYRLVQPTFDTLYHLQVYLREEMIQEGKKRRIHEPLIVAPYLVSRGDRPGQQYMILKGSKTVKKAKVDKNIYILPMDVEKVKDNGQFFPFEPRTRREAVTRYFIFIGSHALHENDKEGKIVFE